jgi:hypothetical protein
MKQAKQKEERQAVYAGSKRKLQKLLKAAAPSRYKQNKTPQLKQTKPSHINLFSHHEIGCELEAIAQQYEHCVHNVGRVEYHLKNVQTLYRIATWLK